MELPRLALRSPSRTTREPALGEGISIYPWPRPGQRNSLRAEPEQGKLRTLPRPQPAPLPPGKVRFFLPRSGTAGTILHLPLWIREDCEKRNGEPVAGGAEAPPPSPPGGPSRGRTGWGRRRRRRRSRLEAFGLGRGHRRRL